VVFGKTCAAGVWAVLALVHLYHTFTKKLLPFLNIHDCSQSHIDFIASNSGFPFNAGSIVIVIEIGLAQRVAGFARTTTKGSLFSCHTNFKAETKCLDESN
jgi:hypothetical protein